MVIWPAAALGKTQFGFACRKHRLVVPVIDLSNACALSLKLSVLRPFLATHAFGTKLPGRCDSVSMCISARTHRCQTISHRQMQGFVSNKDSEEEGKGDPLETLLYAVFVASSERASVAELAGILSVKVPKLQMAISIACRLGFGTRLPPAGHLMHSCLSFCCCLAPCTQSDYVPLQELFAARQHAPCWNLFSWSEHAGLSV